MMYLMAEIVLCLLAAALLGLGAGWLLWGRRDEETTGHAEELERARSRLADLEAELGALRTQSEELSSARAALDDCQKQREEQETLIAALRVGNDTQPAPALRLEYETYKSDKDGQFYFRFLTPDGRVVLRSEGYTRNANCEKGLHSVMVNAPNADRIQRKTSKDDRYFFDVVARNGEIVGTSTLFKSAEARDEIIALFAQGEHVFHRIGDAEQPVGTSLPLPRGERDDLKKIHGIGPDLERVLNERGIYRYEQIARWTQEDVARFSEDLEEFQGRIERDHWIDGAREQHQRKYGRDV